MAAPELRLNVTLDLAAFRGQLGKLAQEAGSRYFGVKLSIDKTDFRKQLKNLEKIKPVITINDSQVIAARERIGTLNKSLATLRRATSTPIEIKIKYVEVGKPPSGGTGQIGKAVSGGVRGSQAIEGFSRSQLQSTRKAMVGAGMSVGEMGNLAKASTDEYKKSIIQGFTNSGQEAINGLAAGLKDSSSKIAQAASKVGEQGVRGIKDALGIASPSKVFRQIGEFSVDGLELGFLNGLKSFKSKSIAEVRTIVALLKSEFAKIQNIGGVGGPTAGSLRQNPVGNRAYSAPIGPQPIGSATPYARGDRGQFGYSGYEPRMVSRLRGQPPAAESNSFLQFSRNAAQVQPLPGTQGSFRGFSQRATQVQQAAVGGGGVPPSGGGGASGGGGVPPGGFPSNTTMLGGRQGPATFIGAGSQMKKFKTAIDVASASTRNFSASQIPLIGGLKGIAGEFGEAAKQVLLYSAAYRGLAFIASLPGQILNAAKSQQQFNNGLKVATQDTGTFAKELLFVDNVQRAFGLNLETTRTGFTRLFASMAPTGFDSGSIEKLFTGISAATAALQLTPDKAERVIYAFEQMASKGQIMAEEVKGQLGDVLPGALSIFAKAAGMSVKEFSKAMEDGEFTGNRFREVFAKVSDELINRFGTGAQIAGKSLQGLINTVGGDFTRTLESFAPLADSAAQATLGPLSRMLKDVGIAAQIAMGEIERVQAQIKDAKQIVVDLKVGGAKPEQIKAAEQNVLALQMRYEQLNTALQDPAMVQRVNDIRNFTTELAKAGTFVMNLAGVIGNVLSPFLTVLGGNFTSVIGNLILFALGFTAIRLAALLFTGTLATVNAAVAANGTISMAAAAKSTVLAGVFRLVGVQATGAQIATIGFGTAVKGLIASTGIGLLVVAVGYLATAFLSMRNRAKEAGEASINAIKEGANAAAMGQVLPVTAQLNQELAKNRVVTEGLRTLERIYNTNKKIMKGGGRPIISRSDMASLDAAKEYSNEIAGIISDNQFKQFKKDEKGFEIAAFLMPDLAQAQKAGGQISAETRKSTILLKEQQQRALREAKRVKLNDPKSGTGTEETEEDKKKRLEEERLAKSQDKLANRQQQLAIDAANQEAALDQSSFDSRLRMNDAEYDHKRALQDDHFQREMSGLDSIEARQKKFQQDLKTIENRRIDSIRKAELDSVKAVQELRSATIKAGEAPGGIVATTGGALGQDPVTRGRSTGAHLHAQAANMTENTLRYLVDKYLEIGGKTATSFEQSRGSAGHGYNAIDFLTPQNTPIKLKGGASISQYGQAGGAGGLMGQVSTPEGNFQLGHLASLTSAQGAGAASQSSSVNLNTRSGAFAMGRRNDKADNKLELEQQQATIKLSEELLTIGNANKLAIEETITLVKQNLDNIFPVKKQQLENDLLRLRNDLESKGVAKEIIDMEVEKAKGTKESTYLLEAYTKEIKENQDALDNYNKQKTFTTKDKLQMDFLKDRIAELNKAKGDMPKAQAESDKALTEGVGLAATSSFESTRTSLKNQMKMARAFTPGQELKTQIGLDHPTATPEQQQILFDTTQAKNALEELKQKANDTASNITESLTGAFKNIVTGSMTMQEGLASSFRSIGDFFADMVMKMIADYLKLQLIEGLKNIFSMFAPGASAVGGLALGGAGGQGAAGSYGSAMSATSSLPSFTGGGGFQPVSMSNFGVAPFANGGMVTGPTLGLVGEGRYNEAIIPLPDGKSVPVQLAGGTEGATAPINTNIVVNVKNGQSDSQVTGNQGNQLGREIEGAVRQVILKEIRPGGIIYGSR